MIFSVSDFALGKIGEKNHGRNRNAGPCPEPFALRAAFLRLVAGWKRSVHDFPIARRGTGNLPVKYAAMRHMKMYDWISSEIQRT